jgi:hypothetical protein
MAQIITPAVQEEIRKFCKAFAAKNMKKPREFTVHWREFRDDYEQEHGGIEFVTKQNWWPELIARGSKEDYDALIAINNGRSDFTDAMIRCILQNLLEDAWKRDLKGEEVSGVLPGWFRGIGAKVPNESEWNCLKEKEEAEDPVEEL